MLAGCFLKKQVCKCFSFHVFSLNWQPVRQRLQMALDTAQGMMFLHGQQPMPLVHRDLKSQNLLVSQNWTVKVADFGTAKVCLWVRDQVTFFYLLFLRSSLLLVV